MHKTLYSIARGASAVPLLLMLARAHASYDPISDGPTVLMRETILETRIGGA